MDVGEIKLTSEWAELIVSAIVSDTNRNGCNIVEKQLSAEV